ncbi:MAG: hypothetical protein R3F41_10635 [Gammaproteobacteria bacterium]|nr:hypothetical protein [Pseudomonadales bacterium]MCP5348064.1 hypothetical protein [Pseudomonadales bacterium]
MKTPVKKYLLGTAVVAALGLGQTGWAQQDASHTDHTGHVTQAGQDAPVDGRAGASTQAMPQGDGQGNRMQQRQGDQQGGGMMENGGMMQNGDMMQHMEQMRRMMAGGQQGNGGGQDAFSAIRAVVDQLEADPETDWSRVNIDALRNHLVDMQELTLNASVTAVQVTGGASYRVTGSGRTLEAIQHMVPTHAAQISSETAWHAEARSIADGVEVTVTAADEAEVARIRALGFFGFMVAGEHHEMHHLAIAGGNPEAMSMPGSAGGHNGHDGHGAGARQTGTQGVSHDH